MRKGHRSIEPHPTNPSLAIVPLTKGLSATISAIDAAAASESNWFVVQWTGDFVYACRKTSRRPGPRKNETLHRFIAARAGIPLDAIVDHVNGNTLDCRRENLRAASPSESVFNTKRRTDNLTGVKGVGWYRGKFRARINFKGKCAWCRFFSTKEEAEAAIRAARTALHGQFSRHA